MRLILLVPTIVAIGLASDAFSQQPPTPQPPTPRVIVENIENGEIAVKNFPQSLSVSGTVSIDNFPDTQDVWIQGVTEPVPTIDVSSKGTPIMVYFEGEPLCCADPAESKSSIARYVPPGPIKITGITARYKGDTDADFQFDLLTSFASSERPGKVHYIYLPKPSELIFQGQKEAYLFQEFSDLPAAIDSISVQAVRGRPGDALPTVVGGLEVSLWGYLLNSSP